MSLPHALGFSFILGFLKLRFSSLPSKYSCMRIASAATSEWGWEPTEML